MGNNTRDFMNHKSVGPGPGVYNISDKIGREGPKVFLYNLVFIWI